MGLVGGYRAASCSTPTSTIHTHIHRLSHVVVPEGGRVPPQARPALEGELRRRLGVEDPEVGM